MRVSILIPTVNRSALLAISLASAQRQTYHDLEVLVSDDGSTDGTCELVREVSRTDARVRLLEGNREPGIFQNVNFLLSHVNGEAFCILGDDDRLDPSFIAHLIEPLAAHPDVVAVFCDHRVIDIFGQVLGDSTTANSRAYGRDTLEPGILANAQAATLARSFPFGFALYRSSVFKGLAFDVDCQGAADWDYTIRAARIGPLFYVKEQLGDYRAHDGTTTMTRPTYMTGGAVRVLQKHRFTDEGLEKRRVELLRVFSRDHAYNSAPINRREALHYVRLGLALGASPFDLKLAASAVLSVIPSSVATRVQDAVRHLPLMHRGRA